MSLKGMIPGLSSFGASAGTDGGQVDPVEDEDDPDQWCAPHWDCFIDCINRTMRPAMCLGVFGMFVFAWAWPAHFLLFGAALKTLPDMIWYVILTIVGGWMASRIRKGGANNNSNATPPAPIVVTTTDTSSVSATTVVAATTASAPVVASVLAGSIPDNHPCLDGPVMGNPSLEAWKKHAH